MILLLRRHIIWLILLLYLLFLNTIILLLYGSTSIISSSRCIPQIQPIERSPKPVTSLVCVAQILDFSCDLGRRKISVRFDLTIGLQFFQLTDHTWASFLLNLFIDWPNNWLNISTSSTKSSYLRSWLQISHLIFLLFRSATPDQNKKIKNFLQLFFANVTLTSKSISLRGFGVIG